MKTYKHKCSWEEFIKDHTGKDGIHFIERPDIDGNVSEIQYCEGRNFHYIMSKHNDSLEVERAVFDLVYNHYFGEEENKIEQVQMGDTIIHTHNWTKEQVRELLKRLL